MYGALVAAMLTTTSAASPDCLWWGGCGYGWCAWPGWCYGWPVVWAPAVTVAPARPMASAREQALEAQVRALQQQIRELQGGKPRQDEASARVVVRLPEDARLFVDNDPCPLTSAERSFNTPRLRPGVPYEYTLRAEVTRDGRAVKESKKVSLRAGEETVVEFSDMRTVQTAGR
jgi:uncharacterized protein (TIGR03000 family)